MVYTTFLEFGIALLFAILVIASIKKVKLEYIVFSALTYIVPTLSGSFSSLPRYVLACFPLFIVLGSYLAVWPKWLRLGIVALFLLLETVSLSLFSRGFWLS